MRFIDARDTVQLGITTCTCNIEDHELLFNRLAAPATHTHTHNTPELLHHRHDVRLTGAFPREFQHTSDVNPASSFPRYSIKCSAPRIDGSAPAFTKSP